MSTRALAQGANADHGFGGRFELGAVLGRGGAGVVYEAFDRLRGEPVAVKVRQLGAGTDVEANAQRVHHRNVVAIHDVIARDGQVAVVMERVTGDTFFDYVLPGGWLDERRLRSVLSQLAQGLLAIHSAGLIHCDLKPSNLLITRSGRLVILDLGSALPQEVAELGGAVGGTRGYMALEQSLGEALSPAADLYAVGVMLQQALAGPAPHGGQPSEGAPSSALHALARALLHDEPSRRPSAERLFAALQISTASVAPPKPSSPNTNRHSFVGREPELAELLAAFADTRQGTLRAAFVTGESGLGKSRLAREVVPRLRAQYSDLLVLEGRCREADTVAFKGLSGIVTELGRALRELADADVERLLPERAGLLPLAFPALGRVPAITRRAGKVKAPGDRLCLRIHIMETLRDVVHALATRNPMLVLLDDLQWLDLDSYWGLAELLRPPHGPSLLFVGTARPCAEYPELERMLDTLQLADPNLLTVNLPPLPAATARELASQRAPELSSERLTEIVRESGGHPLFLEVLADSQLCGVGRLDEAIRQSAAALDGPQRALLDVCSVAGVPIALPVLERAAGLDAITTEAALEQVLAKGLLRVVGRGEERRVEAAHDRIREALAPMVPEGVARHVHERIAGALVELHLENRESLARHLLGAGRDEDAAAVAWTGAEEAAEALAFDKAANLFQWALTLWPPLAADSSRLVPFARALHRAGRGRKAADLYAQLASESSGPARIELQRLQVEALFGCSAFEEGLIAASALASSVNASFTSSRPGAAAAAAYYVGKKVLRGEHFELRTEADCNHSLLTKVDSLWTLVVGLPRSSPLLVVSPQVQHFIAALDAGEASRIADAIATDAIGLYFMGQQSKSKRRVEQAQQLGLETGEHSAMAALAQALLSQFVGDWTLVWTLCLAEWPMMEDDHGRATQLLENVWSLLLVSGPESGDFATFARVGRRLGLRCHQSRGVSPNALMEHARYGFALWPLAIDCLELAQRYGNGSAQVEEVALYRIACARARNYEAPGRVDASQGMLDYPSNDAVIGTPCQASRWLLVSAGCTLAGDPTCKNESSRALLAAHLKRVRKAKWPAPLRHRTLALLEGLLLLRDGKTAEGDALLASSEELCRDTHGTLAQVIGVRRAQLRGGAQGTAALLEQHELMRSAGVRKPLRFLNAMYPGVIDWAALPQGLKG